MLIISGADSNSTWAKPNGMVMIARSHAHT